MTLITFMKSASETNKKVEAEIEKVETQELTYYKFG